MREKQAEAGEHGVGGGEVGVEGAVRGVLTLEPALHIGVDFRHNVDNVVIQSPGLDGAAGPVAVPRLCDAGLAGVLGSTLGSCMGKLSGLK